MSDNIVIGADGVEQIPLKSYTEKAYLDYSMYVILDRALPNIAAVSYTHLTLPTICSV